MTLPLLALPVSPPGATRGEADIRQRDQAKVESPCPLWLLPGRHKDFTVAFLRKCLGTFGAFYVPRDMALGLGRRRPASRGTAAWGGVRRFKNATRNIQSS
jgi:hypothetical protein